MSLRPRLEGSVGPVLVATPDSVHSTFIELQLLIIPQHRRRLRLGGGVVGSVHVPTPGSVHGTLFELQLLIMLRLSLRP